MDDILKAPKFESEAAEARWWFENQDKLAQAFETAAANGTLRRTSLQERRERAALASSVKLDPADEKLARELAASKGETFEVYVKRVMHEALQLEKSA